MSSVDTAIEPRLAEMAQKIPVGPAVFLLVTTAYALLALSAYELFGALSIGVTFFPPAGLTFAALLLLPRRLWAPVVAGIVVGEVVVDMGQGQGLLWSLGWAAANLTEPMVGALVVSRLAPIVELTRRFALAFAVGGLALGPTCGAAIGATVLAVSSDFAWLSSFRDVWVGDALGVLVVAPCILVLARPAGFVPTRVKQADPAVVVVVMVVVGVLLFYADDDPVGYAVVPVLALTALRYSARELAVAAIVVAGALTAATARGRGPWSSDGPTSTHAQLVQQQIFLVMAIAGAWLLKLEVRERVLAVRAAQVAERRLSAAREREREQRHLSAMYDALSALAGATDVARITALVPHHAAAVLDATSAVLALDQSSTGPDGERSPWQEDWKDTLNRADRTGRPVFEVRDTVLDAELPALPGDRPLYAALPLRSGHRRGTLGLARPAGRPWTEGEQLRAVAFASLVADAVKRAEQAELDHRIALTLQEALMPGEIDAPPGLQIAGRYLPATSTLEIGGDWYDLVAAVDGTSVTIVIGDVVGHNLPAAAAMGKLAAAARSLAYAGHPPGELLETLDLVAHNTPDAAVSTIACATLTLATGSLRYSCAGHPPPLLRLPDGTVTVLDGGRGRPLAVHSPCSRPEACAQLEPGSLIVFYTDGLVERRHRAYDDQISRLCSVVARADPARACKDIVAGMLEDSGERTGQHEDDIAILCLIFSPNL